MTALPADKAGLRRHFLALRDAVPADRRAGWSAAIRDRLAALPALDEARTVFCFVSIGPEVDTRPLIDRLHASGRTVLVPCIVDRTTMLACEFRGWEALVTGRMNIPSPDPATAVAWPGTVDAVVTPGLAFTPAGDRLGYGAGFYDRWFARHPDARRIAVGFECQVTPALPVSAQDVPVEWLVTQDRALRLAPR